MSACPVPPNSTRSKDVWTDRVRVLTPYQVNADLTRKAGHPAVKFMHSGASLVFDQAENRLHTIKAVLVATLG